MTQGSACCSLSFHFRSSARNYHSISQHSIKLIERHLFWHFSRLGRRAFEQQNSKHEASLHKQIQDFSATVLFQNRLDTWGSISQQQMQVFRLQTSQTSSQKLVKLQNACTIFAVQLFRIFNHPFSCFFFVFQVCKVTQGYFSDPPE